jgi:hypothetical protein
MIIPLTLYAIICAVLLFAIVRAHRQPSTLPKSFDDLLFELQITLVEVGRIFALEFTPAVENAARAFAEFGKTMKKEQN